MPSLRIASSLDEIPASRWDALHDGRHPFVAHAFLSGLERHGCIRERWGWAPRHLTLWDGDELLAAAPVYRKDNSHGEFVFDHVWAHAHAQHGLDYFPKWLCAVPYSPVTGPRILARNDEARVQLLAAMAALVSRGGAAPEGLPSESLPSESLPSESLSSAHVNFHPESEDAAFDDAGFAGGWLQRLDVQYHWRNASGWRDFDGFLAALDHKHRKNIRQERSKVARAGVRFRTVHGFDASEGDLAAMHGFYLQTFAEYGNHPAITLEFLHHLAATMPRALVVVLAELDGEPIAGALYLRGADTLYGRYWGATRALPGLHFETCYYQGIDYCLREGLTCFEPGAQGEHKLARGFLPTLVRSRHWIAHPGFREALGEWCAQERASIRRYAARLATHSPFKAIAGDDRGDVAAPDHPARRP